MTSLHKKIDTVSELVTAFKFKGELKNISQLFDGHINDTYIFEFLEKNGHTNKYLVQELNTYVFKEPDALMKNVVSVTDYLHKVVIAAVDIAAIQEFFMTPPWSTPSTKWLMVKE